MHHSWTNCSSNYKTNSNKWKTDKCQNNLSKYPELTRHNHSWHQNYSKEMGNSSPGNHPDNH